MGFLLICLGGVVLCLIYLYWSRPLTIHELQQAALKRHRKEQERDRKRAEGYWRERGRTIKPRRTA